MRQAFSSLFIATSAFDTKRWWTPPRASRCQSGGVEHTTAKEASVDDHFRERRKLGPMTT